MPPDNAPLAAALNLLLEAAERAQSQGVPPTVWGAALLDRGVSTLISLFSTADVATSLEQLARDVREGRHQAAPVAQPLPPIAPAPPISQAGQRFITRLSARVRDQLKLNPTRNWDPWLGDAAGPQRRQPAAIQAGLAAVVAQENRYEWLYDQFHEDGSRGWLVDLLAYQILGAWHAALPLNTDGYWEAHDTLETNFKAGDDVTMCEGKPLGHYRLQVEGHAIELFASPQSVLQDLVLGRGRRTLDGRAVGPRPGDLVLQVGAHVGTLTLAYAAMVGAEGRVHASESHAERLVVLQENLLLNPGLAARISLTNEPNAELEHIDFIHIEGHPQFALSSLATLIGRDRPRLAIAIDGFGDDMVDVPRALSRLVPGYSFVLDHYSLHEPGTMLYAEPPTS